VPPASTVISAACAELMPTINNAMKKKYLRRVFILSSFQLDVLRQGLIPDCRKVMCSIKPTLPPST
jgi:hypothetical protein